MELSYKLETFEGPLDLLLSLISKNKIDINDIPISLVCDQYMEYLAKAEAFDIELSSDFIVMASELMLIKSRMLLPRNEEEEEDPRAALAAAVLEYQRAKEASAMLGDLFSHYGLRMAKDTDEITVDKSFVADHDVSLLFKAYNKVMSEIKISDTETRKIRASARAANTVSVAAVVNSLQKLLLPVKEYGSADISGQLRQSRAYHDVYGSSRASENGNACSTRAFLR
ncbi:MAG: segregation and condensation protein A [Lachnospiraceae bacterium]